LLAPNCKSGGIDYLTHKKRSISPLMCLRLT
jgi:hypothetical protein